jgi:hypothetical protein
VSALIRALEIAGLCKLLLRRASAKIQVLTPSACADMITRHRVPLWICGLSNKFNGLFAFCIESGI